MKKEDRIEYGIKGLIFICSSTESHLIKSFLNDKHFDILDIEPDFFTLKTHLVRELPDLIIADTKSLELIMVEEFLEKNFIDIPILLVSEPSESSEDRIVEFVKNHPKCLFLMKPLHKVTFNSSLNLLFNANPPRCRNYVKVIYRSNQVIKLRAEDILFIEAEGNYSFINTLNHKTYAKKKTLKKLKEELGNTFIQINKSHIVNKIFIKGVELGKGILQIGNKEIKVGRAYRQELALFIRNLVKLDLNTE